MNIQPINSVNANYQINQEEKIETQQKKIEPQKGGNKKLALALGALAVSGLVTVGVVRGKGQNIGQNLRSGIDDIINAAKKEVSARKNPKIIKIDEMIKNYEKLLKKSGISEKTKQQVNKRLEALRTQRFSIKDGSMSGSEYFEKVNSQKLSNFIRKLRDNIRETKYNPLSHQYENVVPDSKKKAILKEIKKYTGKDYTPKQLDEMMQLMHLEDLLFVIKNDIKSKRHINLQEHEFLDELSKSVSPHTIDKIVKTLSRDKTKNIEAVYELMKVFDQVQNISGKSFKTIGEVEKYLAGIGQTLIY